MILLGDIPSPRTLDIELEELKVPVYWIHGNHGTDSVADYDHLFCSKLAGNNLHGKVTDILGVKVAGLGGIFRSKVWSGDDNPRFEHPDELLAKAGQGNFWRGGLPLRHRSSIFPADFRALCDQRADILVTHEDLPFHEYGNPASTRLATLLEVEAAFHGHHHETRNYKDRGDPIWQQVGYRDLLIYDAGTSGPPSS